jgi:hypothetical protein
MEHGDFYAELKNSIYDFEFLNHLHIKFVNSVRIMFNLNWFTCVIPYPNPIM